MNQLEFDVKITSGDLYDYMLRHTYHSAQGLLGTCVGVLAIFVFLNNFQPLYLIMGIVIILYLPWTLYLKSGTQVQNNPAFKEPLHYMLDEEGIHVSQGEVRECQKWQDMYRAVSTGRSIIVYTSRVNACIFPRKQLGHLEQQVLAYISTHMEPKKVNIRY